ncbi:MAG TPA: hypothetical protein VEP72_01875 [Microbacterium sp.]|nr:hypothetical protein [Microbacterium sp.]
MAYEPQVWADGEEGETPITAARLNHMEAGIDDAGTPPAFATPSELEAGTVTDARLVSPKLLADEIDRRVSEAIAAIE